eukprot:scaffold2384_cov143-Skeletonema_menzelii.AAC.2
MSLTMRTTAFWLGVSFAPFPLFCDDNDNSRETTLSTKVKQSERERAQRLASSAAGAAMEADCRLEARAAVSSSAADGGVTSKTYNDDNETNTFEPGEGKNAEESFATQFTLEEKAKIREMVANAASAEEIDRIENLVKKGIFPGKNDSSDSIPPPPPPPPPPSEEQDNGASKRQKTGD